MVIDFNLIIKKISNYIYMNDLKIYILLILLCIASISAGAFLVWKQKLVGLLLIILGVAIIPVLLYFLTKKP